MIKQDKINYFELEYDSKESFLGYYEQIQEVTALNPKNVLEIGPGNGVVTDYLRKRGIKITTFDFNKNTNPDIVGDVRKINDILCDINFDVILCAFVLEHLPYNYFLDIIESLCIHSKHLVLVLPNFAARVIVSAKIPSFKEKRWILSLPWKKKTSANPNHYWEIGLRGYSLSRIKSDLEEYFEIKKVFTSKEVPYHKFFILNSRLERYSDDKYIKRKHLNTSVYTV